MPSIQKLTSDDIELSLRILDNVMSRLDSDNFNLPWVDWNTTIAASGSMTLEALQVQVARYCRIGKTINIFLHFTATIAGTPSSVVTFTLPFIPKGGQSPNFACAITDNSTDIAGFAKTSAALTNIINVGRYDGANYTAGADKFFISGAYEVD